MQPQLHNMITVDSNQIVLINSLFFFFTAVLILCWRKKLHHNNVFTKFLILRIFSLSWYEKSGQCVVWLGKFNWFALQSEVPQMQENQMDR